MQFVTPTFGEDLASYYALSSLAYNRKQYTCIDNPAVCYDKIEHQPYAACSGSPHNDESFLVTFSTTLSIKIHRLRELACPHATFLNVQPWLYIAIIWSATSLFSLGLPTEMCAGCVCGSGLYCYTHNQPLWRHPLQ